MQDVGLPRYGCGVRRWLVVLLALGLLSVGLLAYRMSSLASLSSPRSRPFRPTSRLSRISPRFLLIRAIGNALPPRHDPARALQNLRFILEHEQLEDEELATHWVLNRLADEQVAQQFRDLLTEFGAEFTELPLQLGTYAQTPFHVVVEDHGVDEVHSDQTGEDQWTKTQNLNAVYGSKNRYALGINVARNLMLDIARNSGARWLLPWDQACFLTREAWGQIKHDLDAAAPDQKYFVSFMDRLTQENDIIFSPEFKPNPWEEPQIIFRNDSIERFDELLRYGQRDKAALLVRLQVSGVWDGWGWPPWEQRRTYANMSEDVAGPNSVPTTGYVLRLYSGLESDLEVNSQSAGYWREIRRAKGVIDMLNKLEERVMQKVFAYRFDELLIYDETLIQKYKDEAGTEEGKQDISTLLDDANRALQVTNPWAVTNNEVLDPNRDPQVFSNYYDHSTGALDDGELIREMAYNTTALALAWGITNEKKYAAQAAVFLDVWCANATTSMDATLEFADMSYQKLLTSPDGSVRGSDAGIRHTAVIPMLLDAIRLLNSSNFNSSERALSYKLGDKIVLWAQELHDGLNSVYSRDTFRSSPGLFALLYDVQLAALAAFLNNPKSLRFTLGTMQGRLITMMSPEEKLLIPTGIATEPYALLMLAAWCNVLELAQRFGVVSHLFQFDLTRNRREERVNEEGGLLCRFVGHSVPCCQPEATSGHTGQCITALQYASEAQLFIYSRIVQQAAEHCPILRKRPSCASIALLQPDLTAISSYEWSRYLLPPYRFLYKQT